MMMLILHSMFVKQRPVRSVRLRTEAVTVTEMETDVLQSALKRMSRIQTTAVRRAVKVVRA